MSECVHRMVQDSRREIRVLTTYLDNDDAVDLYFVEDIRQRAAAVPDGTFINYTHGYQFFTGYNYMMRVHYPRNHFISVVEKGDSTTLKTIYGYGSHYYIDRIKGVRIENVENCPMWCEVIHEKNMGNDAYSLFGTKMVRDESLMKSSFGIQQEVSYGAGIIAPISTVCETLFRRVGYKLFGRKW